MLCCENCHAPIQEDDAACPYCGALNASGGEKKYMERLYELKEDTEELSRVPEREYRKEMRRIGRIIGRTVLIFTIAAVFICGMFFLFVRRESHKPSEEDVREQLLWERENFPKLDAMYAEGDYESIRKYVCEDEEGYHSISNWKHSDFLDVYICYHSCKERAEKTVSKEDDAENEIECIIDALFLIQERSYVTYSDTEEEQIEKYRREVRELLGTRLGMQEGELDLLYGECCLEDEYGVYFDYKTARKKVEKYVKDKRR